MNLRVVRTWGPAGESYLYHFEDIYESRYSMGLATHPFVQHDGNGIFEADSLKDLERVLDAAKAALKKPVLTMTDPKLVELKKGKA